MKPASSIDFQTMLHDEQITWLEQALDKRQDPRKLLEICATVRDNAPLAWLCGELRDRGWYADMPAQQWFATFLIQRPDTAIHSVLKALTRDVDDVPEIEDHVARTLTGIMEEITIQRLSAMCLIDRSLKHNFPQARKAYFSRVKAQCSKAISTGRMEDITIHQLCQLSASDIDELKTRASKNKSHAIALQKLHSTMASTSIRILGDAPKGVSQTNAEELLSRRVYTDPGHFLVELLQNAEDAGATEWHLTFDRNTIVVWHNGIAFDAKDLVGICSIGQTTKRKQQIGFFGVGFKSVYEITSRPRIYSDAFQFEIADVSIPKELGKRPSKIPAKGTTLIFPLKDPDDNLRSSEVLYIKARDMDPCILFTLRSIDLIRLELTRKAGGPEEHEIIEEHGDWSSIRQSPKGWLRSYILQDDEYVYDLSEREPGRPDRSRIMVGVLLDKHHCPVPLEDGIATVYSYLPTSEFTGLRFFVQGHFDVPVDRERLNQESLWNKWILAAVPHQLASIAERLISGEHPLERKQEIVLGFMNILPLESDIASPIFTTITDGLPPALSPIPFVPGEDGQFHAPKNTLLSGRRIIRLFDHSALDASLLDPGMSPGENKFFAEHSIDHRNQAVLRSLGCINVDTGRLVDILENALRDTADGGYPEGDWVPEFLRTADTKASIRLCSILLDEVERLELGADGETAASDFLDRIGIIPIFPVESGGLCRADPDENAPEEQETTIKKKVYIRTSKFFSRLKHKLFHDDEDEQDGYDEPVQEEKVPLGSGLVRGSQAMREIYGGTRNFICIELDSSCKDQLDPSLHSTNTLLDRLEVVTITVEELVEDLEEAFAGSEGPWNTLDGLDIPGGEDRLPLIFKLLESAPQPLQLRTSRLPLFKATDGNYYPVARNPEDVLGILNVDGGVTCRALSRFYGTTRPILQYREEPGAMEGLIDQLGVPVLSLDILISDLNRVDPLFKLDVANLRALHRVLESLRRETPDRIRNILVKLPIWPDRTGKRRPLRGAEAVRVPMVEPVVDLFPAVPFIDPEVGKRKHLADINISRVGVEAVISAFGPNARPPFRIKSTPENVTVMHSILRDRLDHVGSKVRKNLSKFPVFLNDRGEVGRLKELSVGSDKIRHLFEGWSGRRFISEESLELVTALKLENNLHEAHVTALLDDLEELCGELELEASETRNLIAEIGMKKLQDILTFIGHEVKRMVRSELVRCTSLAIFPDQNGQTGPMADLNKGWAGEAGLFVATDSVGPLLSTMGLRQLDPRFAQLIQPIMKAAHVPVVDADGMISILATLKPSAPSDKVSPMQTSMSLGIIQKWLVSEIGHLGKHYPQVPRDFLPTANPVLNGLAIWETQDSFVTTADEVVDAFPKNVIETFGERENRMVTAVTLDRKQQKMLAALAPLVSPIPGPVFLQRMVTKLARPGRNLSEQPKFLSSVENIMGMAKLLAPDRMDQDGMALALDGEMKLRMEPLHWCDRETYRLIQKTSLSMELLHPDFIPLAENGAIVCLEPVDKLEIIKAILDPGDNTGAEGALKVEEHKFLRERECRLNFYSWLSANEREIFSDPRCRKILMEREAFLSEREHLLTARELVIDADLPDLGMGWGPHKEIPKDTLQLLVRHLEAGTPPLKELIGQHLLPAYHEAVEINNVEQAGLIFLYLARRLGNHDTKEIHTFLIKNKKPFLIEDLGGNFKKPQELLLPPPEIADHIEVIWGDDYGRPSSTRYPQRIQSFLLELGVASSPSLKRVQEAIERQEITPNVSISLAALINYLSNHHAKLETKLGLGEFAWVTDGTGIPKRPDQLFLSSINIRALIGGFPELYPDSRILQLLGEKLGSAIGFKGLERVGLPEINRHIDARKENNSKVPFIVYEWMELELKERRLDPKDLRKAMSGRRWICTDDGEYFHHSRVLGSYAIHLFGKHRGYWVRGWERCPELCKLFKIPKETSSELVAGFLAELAVEIEKTGDREILEKEAALPRMLLACYAILGKTERAVDRDLPIILCEQRGKGKYTAGTQRLLRSDNEGILRSDTPTLEALFEKVGSFHVTVPGMAKDAELVDRFHTRMGIRRIRDAYEVTIDTSAGKDLTADQPEEIQKLRGVLRALYSAIPRIKAQRVHLIASGWVEEQRLRPLLLRGGINVFKGLRVLYRLEGVGVVKQQVSAAFDPSKGVLFVDEGILYDLRAHITDLASSLIGCIYEGPGEEQLADIVEILLPMETREAMHTYLDRRHFPQARHATSPKDQISERIGELLDYGFDALLVKRFPELAEANVTAWRDPDLLSSMKDTGVGLFAKSKQKNLAEEAANLMFEKAGVKPGDELRTALETLLSASSLTAARTKVFGDFETGEEPSLAGGRQSSPREAKTSGGELDWEEHEDRSTSDQEEDEDKHSIGGSLSGWLEGLLARAITKDEKKGQGEIGRGKIEKDPSRELPEDQKRKEHDKFPGSEGLHNFFRSHRPKLPSIGKGVDLPSIGKGVDLPSWAKPDSYTLKPKRGIHNQLWSTSFARSAISSTKPKGGVSFEPENLQKPWYYGVYTLGLVFDHKSQSWLDDGSFDSFFMKRLLNKGHFDGNTVYFETKLRPGISQLPMPIHSKLRHTPVLEGSSNTNLEVLERDGFNVLVKLKSRRQARVTYEVDLLIPPDLKTSSRMRSTGIPKSLLQPSVPLNQLHPEVQDWLVELKKVASPWHRSLRAQNFVQRRYVYDDDFTSIPAVKKRRSTLKKDIGNHYIELLHASGNEHHLGRGICYELNTLLVELLRHLEVPTMAATGWVFKGGWVDRPNHLFAMSLLPAQEGACLVPMDSSTGVSGPRVAFASAPAKYRPASKAGRKTDFVKTLKGIWDIPTVHNIPRGGEEKIYMRDVMHEEKLRREEDIRVLERAIKRACKAMGMKVPPDVRRLRRQDITLTEHTDALRSILNDILPRRGMAGTYLALLRGEFDSMAKVPRRVQELIDMGLATMKTSERYRIEAR